jgi:hypothetical protein
MQAVHYMTDSRTCDNSSERRVHLEIQRPPLTIARSVTSVNRAADQCADRSPIFMLTLGPPSAAPGRGCSGSGVVSPMDAPSPRRRSFGRLAGWWPRTAVLFAERGERRDFPDEFRPQRPGQVMAHA